MYILYPFDIKPTGSLYIPDPVDVKPLSSLYILDPVEFKPLSSLYKIQLIGDKLFGGQQLINHIVGNTNG